QIFLIWIGRGKLIDPLFPTPINGPPARNRTTPKLRYFRNRNHARANILTPLAVVRGSGQERGWPVSLPLLITLMKCFRHNSELLRLASHFIQSCQAVENVKDGVFQS